MKIKGNRRDSLKLFLEQNGIPTMIYYPIPLNEQQAYKKIGKVVGDLEITYQLCETVLSIPMHTELTEQQQVFITDKIKYFLNS
jgi:dTDP-4-amino-4,6-dideoxygalactose transaminase